MLRPLHLEPHPSATTAGLGGPGPDSADGLHSLARVLAWVAGPLLRGATPGTCSPLRAQLLSSVSECTLPSACSGETRHCSELRAYLTGGVFVIKCPIRPHVQLARTLGLAEGRHFLSFY